MAKGSSGFDKGGSKKSQEFEGSEKQVKWANDIVEKAKKSLQIGVYEVENPSWGSVRPEEVERAKIVSEITNNVLSNLSSAWSAKDVIENRDGLERYPYSVFGIKMLKKELRIGDRLYGFSTYSYSDLKKSSVKKEFENKVIDYLKKKKG